MSTDAISNTPTFAEVLRVAIDARLADVHTAIPARVETYDAAKQRVSVKPLIRRGYLDEDGQRAVESLPVINEVPIVFPGAGGFRVTFPVAPGDTVLLVFSEASIDRWLPRGGDVDPADDRRFSLNDAIAIPGLRSFAAPLASAPADVMTAGKDGGPVIEFDGSEIRAGGSSALALAGDLESLRAAIAGAASGNAVPGAAGLLGPFTGTTILKGE
jgi:hypothetical protein